MSKIDDPTRRWKIGALLSNGLATEVFPRADTSEKFQSILARVREAGGDLSSKLVAAGFTLQAVTHEGMEQACETCMYFQVHRRHCELPELDLPVEPGWSCRLWRI